MDEGQAFRPVPFNIGLLVQVQSEYQHLIYKYRTVNSHLFNSLHLFTPFRKNCISARYIYVNPLMVNSNAMVVLSADISSADLR